jgi:hypothetical protein
VAVVRRQRPLLVIELPLQHPKARIGQMPSVTPAQQLLAPRVDDLPAGP